MLRKLVTSPSGVVLVLLVASQAEARSRTPQWSEPQHLGCLVNSPFAEAGPALSRDGRSLFFGSQRPDGGAQGSFDIWVSQRASVDAPWSAPVNLGSVINTSGIENVPVLSRDQHWLYFNSNRHSGSVVDVDIYASYRADVRDDFGWQPPIQLGSGVNSTGFDAGATLLERGNSTTLYFSRGANPNITDVYVSEAQPDGRFGTAVLVPELSSTANDQRPSIRRNGRELYLYSNRTGTLGGNDIWVSTRNRASDPWNTPTNLGTAVNGTFNDSQAHIAPDAQSLYFVSDRPGFCGDTANLDLYVSFRQDDDGDESSEVGGDPEADMPSAG